MDMVDNKPKQKFTLLYRGFSIDNGEPLIDCFQIQEGKFPVRYLGEGKGTNLIRLKN
jgi:hypothetical protein